MCGKRYIETIPYSTKSFAFVSRIILLNSAYSSGDFFELRPLGRPFFFSYPN